jgi:hypothetical protein
MRDEVLQPPAQFSMMACTQALHLLCQGLRGDIVLLAGANQLGRGLGPLEEILLISDIEQVRIEEKRFILLCIRLRRSTMQGKGH